MTIFKRGSIYYIKFRTQGKQILRSLETHNEREAKRRANVLHEKLQRDAWQNANEPPKTPEVQVPTLKEFVRLPEGDDPGGRWWANYATAAYTKPATVQFFQNRLKKILTSDLAAKPLHQISNEDLDRYTSAALATGLKNATVNRDLAVLRIVLRRAKRWGLIRELPDFELMSESEIGFAISTEDEDAYMAAVDDDHGDWTQILISTAMMPAEAASLLWSDVHFGPIGEWEDGYIHDRSTKTRYRARRLAMTPKLAERLKARKARQGASLYVFPSDHFGMDHPTPLGSFQTRHQRVWMGENALKIPKFRVYDFRHTALTRAHEAGATILELMDMAGWSSPAMAKRYVKLSVAKRVSNVRRMADHVERVREKSRMTGEAR